MSITKAVTTKQEIILNCLKANDAGLTILTNIRDIRIQSKHLLSEAIIKSFTNLKTALLMTEVFAEKAAFKWHLPYNIFTAHTFLLSCLFLCYNKLGIKTLKYLRCLSLRKE